MIKISIEEYENLKKEHRKKIKKKGRNVRFNNTNSVTFSDGKLKLGTNFYRYSYRKTIEEENQKIYTYSESGRVSDGIIEDMTSFWEEYAAIEGYRGIFISSSNILEKQGYIKMNADWYKRLTGLPDKKEKFMVNLFQNMRRFYEKDPTFSCFFNHNEQHLKEKEIGEVFFNFWIGENKYRVDIIHYSMGKFLVTNQETKEEEEFSNEKKLIECIKKWIEEAYKRHRIDHLFQPPKVQFDSLMRSLNIYNGNAYEQLYAQFVKKFKVENVEKESIELMKQGIEKYHVKPRGTNITLFKLFNNWHLVCLDVLEIYEEKEVEKAVKRFKELTMKEAIGEKLEKKLSKINV